MKYLGKNNIYVIVIGVVILLITAAIFIQNLVSQEKSGGDWFAITNVNVIPMDKEQVLADQTVLIRDGRITQIGSSSSIKMPSGVTEIDGAGKYLIPAFSDMHVHLLGLEYNLLFPPEAQLKAEDLDYNKILFPYVANGVTMVEIMSAIQTHFGLRDQIVRGEVLGPRLILDRMIDAPGKALPEPLSVWVSDAASARQAVLDAKKAGYDRMKVYTFLSSESYDSILATAKEIGMPVGGHIPSALSVEYILKAGQNRIAHTEEITRMAKGDYSPERIDYFAGIIADSDVWLSPTLVTSKHILDIFDDYNKVLARLEMRYDQHPMEQALWSFLLNNYYLPTPKDARQDIRDGYEQFGRPFTKVLQDKGGRLLTGTDSGWATLVPGFALHEELQELVAAGLTPYQALKAATANPYEFLGELEEAGTVETGKRANLVLLEANPLENISNTQRIAGVMIQNRWLSKADIQTGMDDVLAYYETFKK